MIIQHIVDFIKNNSEFSCVIFTLLLTNGIVPYIKHKYKLKSFCEYFFITHKLNSNGYSIYDFIQQNYIANCGNHSVLVAECYKNGLNPLDVFNYVNNKSTIPYRIKKNFTILFPYKNNLICILYKCRFTILWSALIIGIIILFKFV